jgi:hypothetical protein
MNHPRTTLAFAIATAAVLLGCSGGDSGIVGCADSTVCAIAAGGQCLPAPVGFDVCAYPAAECPSGLAWSPEAGTLAGTCVAAAIDARIPTCGELGCSAIGTFCQPDGSCTCTPPGGSETTCTESRDAGSGPDAGDSGTDASWRRSAPDLRRAWMLTHWCLLPTRWVLRLHSTGRRRDALHSLRPMPRLLAATTVLGALVMGLDNGARGTLGPEEEGRARPHQRRRRRGRRWRLRALGRAVARLAQGRAVEHRRMERRRGVRRRRRVVARDRAVRSGPGRPPPPEEAPAGHRSAPRPGARVSRRQRRRRRAALGRGPRGVPRDPRPRRPRTAGQAERRHRDRPARAAPRGSRGRRSRRSATTRSRKSPRRTRRTAVRPAPRRRHQPPSPHRSTFARRRGRRGGRTRPRSPSSAPARSASALASGSARTPRTSTTRPTRRRRPNRAHRCTTAPIASARAQRWPSPPAARSCSSA